MSPRPAHLLTRRQVLVGATAATGAVLLGACGGGDDEVDASDTTATSSSLALAQFFGGPMFAAGQENRFPFGVADQDGLLPIDRTPERLTVQLLDPEGAEVGSPIEVARRSDGLPRAYFPLLATIAEPGIYTARTEVDGAAAEMSVKVDAATDLTVVQPGSAMPALETPTTADARGVTPICTNDPVCPLHDVTVGEALGEGRPMALLVATPAFCQIAICGPVLDVLLDVSADHPDVRFLHAEVYADPERDLETQAPVVAGLGLHFEPCLVLVGADGNVVERLDTIYDRSELGERLARLA
jgi:hypothetical protein